MQHSVFDCVVDQSFIFFWNMRLMGYIVSFAVMPVTTSEKKC